MDSKINNERASLVNIGKNKDDIFYRYKRDKIILEKRGNKTEIKNILAIQKQLKVSDKLLEKFYRAIKKNGYAMIKTPLSTTNGVMRVFRGDLKLELVEAILEEFIKRYVLCKRCGLPELHEGSGVCQSCGEKVRNK